MGDIGIVDETLVELLAAQEDKDACDAVVDGGRLGGELSRQGCGVLLRAAGRAAAGEPGPVSSVTLDLRPRQLDDFFHTPDIDPFSDWYQLRRAALEQTGVSFCTRLHCGRALPGEERRYLRLAYSGISAELIHEGLGRLKEWAQ